MRLYSFLLVVILFLSPAAGVAKNKPLTKLPTIVVRGEDRSYLEIVRIEKLPYMSPRGEKKKTTLTYETALPPREEFTAKFPIVSISFPHKVSITPRRKVYPPFIFSSTLSRTYIKERGISFPSLLSTTKKEKIPLKEIKVRKELIHPPLKVFAGRKEIYFSSSFPILSVKPSKVVKGPPRKKILAYFPPVITLSQRYIREGKIEISPVAKVKLPILKRRIYQKMPLQPQVSFIPPPKESYSTHFVKIAKKKRMRVIKAEKKLEIHPLFFLYPTLSQRYIREEKLSLPINTGRLKVKSPKKMPEKKELLEPPIYAKLPEKVSLKISFPKTAFKAFKFYPVPEEKEISPQIYPAFTKQLYLKDTPAWPKEERASFKLRLAEVKREEKELIHPPLSVPFFTKVYFPESIKKSRYPYLHLSLGASSYDSFNYQLRYGRERNKKRYLLDIERDYSSRWINYKNSELEREEDILFGKVMWEKSTITKTGLSLQGNHKVAALPGTGKRTDTLFSLEDETTLFENWKINLWGETTLRTENNTINKQWNDINYGVSLTLHLKNYPIFTQGAANWDNLAEKNVSRNNNYQASLQVGTSHPLSIGKNLFSQIKLGVRGVKNEKAKPVGAIKLNWGASNNIGIELNLTRDFHLLKFSDIYLSQPYSEVDSKLDPTDTTDYSININYFNSPWIDLNLKWFNKKGNDLVWIYQDTPEPRLSPRIIKLSQQGWRLTGNWNISPSITLQPSYTWQNVKNEQIAGKVIPHIPQSQGKLLLRIKTGRWWLETTGEWFGKRYYTFEKDNVLPSGSKIALKIGYTQKEWEAFLETENNDKYFLSKNYQFPDNKITVGIKLKLF